MRNDCMIACFADFELDLQRLELLRGGVPVRADPMVLRVLRALVESPGQLVTKSELIARVWERRTMSRSVLSVSIARLRKTLSEAGATGELVASVPGLGYRFVSDVTTRAGRMRGPLRAAPLGAHAGPTIVGRAAVRARMMRMLSAANAGRGGVCLLTGEAGIGKTAAAEQLATAALASGVRVAWASCAQDVETPPLWPFLQLVRALLQDASPGERTALAPELAALVPELAHAPCVPARATSKHRLFEAVLAVLERFDTVVVIDDLHRVDALSLELLRYWMSRIGQQRVLVVATMRTPDAGAPSRDQAAIVGHVHCTRIALDRLDPASVEAYVRHVLPDAEQPIAHAVWEKSEGNPFFMVELVRRLADAPRPCVELIRVSEQALQLLAPRVTQIEPASRMLLSVAAVIGRRFSLRLLRQVTGQPLEEILDVLEQAVASETLVVDADAGTAYAFGHDLIRQLFRDALTVSERRHWHLKVADALAQRAAAGEVVPTATRAYHHHAALPSGDPVAALNHCQRAAHEAATMFAHADSVRLLQHALEALSLFEHASPMLRLMLLFQQAVSARIAGDVRFAQIVHEVAAVARGARAGAYLIEIALLLHVHPGFPTLPGARALLEEGLALLGEGDDTARGAALARLATCGPIAFDAERSRALIQRALALTGENALLHSYNAHAAGLYLSPRGERAHALEAVLERLTEAPPRVLQSAPALGALHAALLAHQDGLLGEAGAALARLRSHCRKLGHWELDWHAARYQILLRLQQVGADAIAAELRAHHARSHADSVVGGALMHAFDAVVVLGEPCEPRHRALLAYCPDDPPSIWSMKAHALAVAGLHDDATAALAAVRPDRFAMLPRDRDHLGTLGALARTAVLVGAREPMRSLYRALQPHRERLAVHVSCLCLGPVAQLLGELASALGERDDALAHFGVACVVAERLGLSTHLDAARRAAVALSRTLAPPSRPHQMDG